MAHQPTDTVPPSAEESDRVSSEIREVLARLDRRPTDDARELLQAMSGDRAVLGRLDRPAYRLYRGVFEVLLFECINNTEGTLELSVVTASPLLHEYSSRVTTELAEIASMAASSLPGHAFTRWEALRESVQRRRSLNHTRSLVTSLEEREPLGSVMDAWQKVVAEPPTVRRTAQPGRTVRTAREVDAEQRARLASSPPVRFSSGYRTLDLALTGDDEPIGFIAPGEQNIFAGMTGTGKSSFSYGIVAAMTEDLRNWGFEDGLVAWFHTEEASSHKVAAAGLNEHGRFHHLADNVVVDNIGSSRRRIAEVLYETVIDAQRKADLTGRPITDFLVHIMVLDYIQAVTGEANEDPVRATFNTAELVMRGVQAWNPEEIAKFSGVSFQDYAGRAWPDGMENHEIAVVTFAQLNKQDDRLMLFRPNSKDHPIEEFTLEDSRDEPAYRDPSGRGWWWEVRPNDARILRQNQVSGSGQVLKNATNLVFLHRSRPYNNPAHVDTCTGESHLEDTRARLLPDKTRNGSALKVIPMAFDVNPNGPGARYFDIAAERALAEGRFVADDTWAQPGDPILPPRPKPHPLAGVRY